MTDSVLAPPVALAPGGTLEKGLALLELVARLGEASPARLGERLGISRSATYRLVERLRGAGYLEDGRTAGSVAAAPRTLTLGLSALGHVDLVRIAPPYLHRLATVAGETVNLAVPIDDEVVYIHQEEGPGGVKVSARLGSRRPLSCSSLGKAYLAALPDAVLADRLATLPYAALTDASITDPRALRAELDSVRSRGYAADRAEVEPGVACLGAAIRDFRGTPVAAVSVAGPAYRVADREPLIAPLLLETTTAISQRLGYLA